MTLNLRHAVCAGVALVWLAGQPAIAQVSSQVAGNLTSDTCNADGSGGGCVTLLLSGGQAGVAIQIGASVFSGTITFEGSVDGGTYQPLLMMPLGTTTAVTTATGAGIWTAGVGGLVSVRARMSSYTSGTAGVNIGGSMSAGASGTGTGGSGGTVAGTLTNNNAAPITNQLDVMPCLSGSAALSYTTGRSVKGWCNLFGAQATFYTDPSTGAATALAPEAPSATSAALTECGLVSAASTNATNCLAAAGRFYGLWAINTTATIYYLRLYNLATAPTCSSATGFIRSIPIPASTSGSGMVMALPYPASYSTGIGYCFTGGSSSTDNTNAATGVFGVVWVK